MNAEGGSPWPTVVDRDAERQIKRGAALATGVRFVEAKRFHATNLDGVTMALRVTKLTSYYYFSSKEDILFEWMAHCAGAIC